MRTRSDLLVGALASAGAVALVTTAIELARRVAPVLSLGVLYVFAVLPIAIVWGLGLATVVSVASMLAFNWFFLPPTHTFRLREGENWLALAVYLVVAVVVSALATRARRRAAEAEQREREAAALATVSGELLRGVTLQDELERLGALAARVLGLPGAWIELGETEAGLALNVGDRHVGALVPAGGEPDRAVARRFLPALASLLAVALDRAALEREALEAETLRRSDAVKTAVLRAVSHDLRSPLTAISAAASGLGNPELKLEQRDRAVLVETIRTEAARLDRVVGNLLDLSRLQAGAARPQPEIWDVDELVAQALEELRERGVRVAVELDPELPPVRVDAAQIQRVLVNLLDNALKFSPSSTPVRLRTETADGELRVHVLDEGPGFAPGERERAFEPFRRGEGVAEQGAGLGLAIARGFAEANGARVWAEPAAEGAHLVLALPVLERSPARA